MEGQMTLDEFIYSLVGEELPAEKIGERLTFMDLRVGALVAIKTGSKYIVGKVIQKNDDNNPLYNRVLIDEGHTRVYHERVINEMLQVHDIKAVM